MKSEIDVFFEKLRFESPQMLKSQKLLVSVYLRLNIPQTALVAALDTYDFLSNSGYGVGKNISYVT
jgi:hypothetical protein